MALYEIMNAGRYEVLALVTTVTLDYDRISMHGVRSSCHVAHYLDLISLYKWDRAFA
jgi:hypothetical protein